MILAAQLDSTKFYENCPPLYLLLFSIIQAFHLFQYRWFLPRKTIFFSYLCYKSSPYRHGEQTLQSQVNLALFCDQEVAVRLL